MKMLAPVWGILLLCGCAGETRYYHTENTITGTASFGEWRGSLQAQRGVIYVGGMLDLDACVQVCMKIRELEALESATDITLLVLSPGGDMNGMVAIGNEMRSCRKKIHVINCGMVGSAALDLFGHATGRRTAFAGSRFMIHGGAVMNTDARDAIRENDLLNTAAERFYQDRFRLPAEWFPLKPDRLHYFSAEDALRYRVIDAICASSYTVTPQP